MGRRSISAAPQHFFFQFFFLVQRALGGGDSASQGGPWGTWKSRGAQMELTNITHILATPAATGELGREGGNARREGSAHTCSVPVPIQTHRPEPIPSFVSHGGTAPRVPAGRGARRKQHRCPRHGAERVVPAERRRRSRRVTLQSAGHGCMAGSSRSSSSPSGSRRQGTGTARFSSSFPNTLWVGFFSPPHSGVRWRERGVGDWGVRVRFGR